MAAPRDVSSHLQQPSHTRQRMRTSGGASLPHLFYIPSHTTYMFSSHTKVGTSPGVSHIISVSPMSNMGGGGRTNGGAKPASDDKPACAATLPSASVLAPLPSAPPLLSAPAPPPAPPPAPAASLDAPGASANPAASAAALSGAFGCDAATGSEAAPATGTGCSTTGRAMALLVAGGVTSHRVVVAAGCEHGGHSQQSAQCQQGGVPETGGTLWRYSFSSASKSGTSMPAGDGWNSTRHACGVLPLAFLLEEADTRRCTRNCFSAGDDRSLMLSTKTGRKGLMPCESLLYSSHSTKKAAMRWTSRGGGGGRGRGGRKPLHW